MLTMSTARDVVDVADECSFWVQRFQTFDVTKVEAPEPNRTLGWTVVIVIYIR